MPATTRVSGLDYDPVDHWSNVAAAGVTLALIKLQTQLRAVRADLERLPAGDPFVRSTLEYVEAVTEHIRNTPTAGPRLSRTPAPGGIKLRGAER